MKQLPKVEALGVIELNFVKVYAPSKGVVFKAHRANGDDPKIFVDLEHLRPEFQQQNGCELHIGISAKFKTEALRNSKVKPHIDAYAPEVEIEKLKQALARAGRRGR